MSATKDPLNSECAASCKATEYRISVGFAYQGRYRGILTGGHGLEICECSARAQDSITTFLNLPIVAFRLEVSVG